VRYQIFYITLHYIQSLWAVPKSPVCKLRLKVLNSSAERQLSLCDRVAHFSTDSTVYQQIVVSVLVGSPKLCGRGKHECRWFWSYMQWWLSCKYYAIRWRIDNQFSSLRNSVALTERDAWHITLTGPRGLVDCNSGPWISLKVAPLRVNWSHRD